MGDGRELGCWELWGERRMVESWGVGSCGERNWGESWVGNHARVRGTLRDCNNTLALCCSANWLSSLALPPGNQLS